MMPIDFTTVADQIRIESFERS